MGRDSIFLSYVQVDKQVRYPSTSTITNGTGRYTFIFKYHLYCIGTNTLRTGTISFSIKFAQTS